MINNHKFNISEAEKPLLVVDFNKIFEDISDLKKFVQNDIQDVQDLRSFLEQIRNRKAPLTLT